MENRTGLYRPAYHFMPPAHWMNDPNGPVWYQGHYHLFYQHNPTGDGWGNLHWGHARSADLVNWEHLPIALAPDAAAGEEHCFSGCTVLDGEVPTILYSSVEKGRNQRHWATIRLARSYDGMMTWEREPQPVLTQDIHPERVGEWRDPFVWHEDGEWHMLVGGERRGYGCIFLYRSPNLMDWRYIGPFFEDASAPFLECPNLLRFGGQSVLLYAPHGEVVYHVGKITPGGRFEAHRAGVLDSSGRRGFYAPSTLLNDPEGRTLTWGWVTEEARGGLAIEGYNGALSLPRELTLDKDGALCQRPAAEYAALRGAPLHLGKLETEAMPKVPLRGRSLEIAIRAEYGAEDDFSLVLLRSPDGNEQTRVHFSAREGTVTLERSLTSLHNDPDKTFQCVRMEPAAGKLELRVFLDHSMIEIFVGGRQAITGRLYPAGTDADGIALEGRVKTLDMTLWPLRAK